MPVDDHESRMVLTVGDDLFLPISIGHMVRVSEYCGGEQTRSSQQSSKKEERNHDSGAHRFLLYCSFEKSPDESAPACADRDAIGVGDFSANGYRSMGAPTSEPHSVQLPS